MKRLSAAIASWRDCLVGTEDESIIDTSMDTKPLNATTNQFKLGGAPEVEVIYLLIQYMYRLNLFFKFVSLHVHVCIAYYFHAAWRLCACFNVHVHALSCCTCTCKVHVLYLCMNLPNYYCCCCCCCCLQAISHELHITNQMMDLDPPLELTRCHLIAELHKWVSTVIGLQRIQSARYQVGGAIHVM